MVGSVSGTSLGGRCDVVAATVTCATALLGLGPTAAVKRTGCSIDLVR